MVNEKDFIALLRVFRGVVTEMAGKDTFMERKVCIMDWIETMAQVDRAIGGILTENSREERFSMVRDFEKTLKELGYDL